METEGQIEEKPMEMTSETREKLASVMQANPDLTPVVLKELIAMLREKGVLAAEAEKELVKRALEKWSAMK